MKHGDWAGKIQLDYKPNPDLLIYAGVSRGIRSGGFNSSPDGTIPLTSTPFSAETVYSYETGTKLRLLENRASLRVSAFYYDYHNFQGFNFQNLVAVVANNPAHFYGAEAEFSITPMERLNISFGGSALRGKVEDLSTPQGVQNVEPVKAPHYTFNGIISKTFDVADGEINLQYDFNYISKSSSNLVPSRVTELPASWMQNARVSYGRPDEGWEVFLWCRNLTNAARKNFAYDNVFLGGNLASYAPPRMYGVGARKTF
jgi:iron complex outermembrane receptor protein